MSLLLPSACLELSSAFTMSRGGVTASRVLHSALVSRLLRAPLSFYETVPLGRIMNRCSSDTSDVDLVMPFTIRSVINVILISTSTLAIVMWAYFPWILVLLPFICLIYWLIQVRGCLSPWAAGGVKELYVYHGLIHNRT